MTSPTTPYGPAIIGVSEIENRSVLDDLVVDPQIAAWNLQVVHHDSPDRRGVDVGCISRQYMAGIILIGLLQVAVALAMMRCGLFAMFIAYVVVSICWLGY